MTPQGHGHVLAEPFLEGKFQKWNNNGGGVKKVNQDDLNLGVIGEDDEQDDEVWVLVKSAQDSCVYRAPAEKEGTFH